MDIWQRHAGCAGARQAAFLRPALCNPSSHSTFRAVVDGAGFFQMETAGELREALYEIWWFTPGIFLVMVAPN
jgi:hypothetical protein